MNMAILDSQEFSVRVQQRLENFGRVVDTCTWEAFKGELRELAEAFSHSKAAEARQEEQALTGTLRIILEEEEKRPGTFAEDIRHCKTRFRRCWRRGCGALSSKAQVEAALQHVAVFSQASGAEVNRRKSIGAWLGDWATTPKIFADIEWRTTVDSYLGAPIGECGPTVEKWRQQTNAIQAKLSPWLGRRLSLFNRASTMERTRRSNLFLSLAAGGLGLVNVVLKLHVQRFLLFRDRRDPLFLSAVHHLGYPYLGRRMVSTTGRTTRGAGLRFYAEIAASVEFFLVHFSWEYFLAASRKTLYWDTLAIVLPVPLYRMEPVPLCAAGLFKRVQRFPVPASTKDFFIRLHLEVLPVKVWLDARFLKEECSCDVELRWKLQRGAVYACFLMQDLPEVLRLHAHHEVYLVLCPGLPLLAACVSRSALFVPLAGALDRALCTFEIKRVEVPHTTLACAFQDALRSVGISEEQATLLLAPIGGIQWLEKTKASSLCVTLLSFQSELAAVMSIYLAMQEAGTTVAAAVAAAQWHCQKMRDSLSECSGSAVCCIVHPT
ncbi:hypothetical protein HPB47_017254 [Ixodes persulcatus]|uniref:Uncharacterized protein n=1 Tax=Ixodes persulcatus TaxID=34615 RepID=A0AC60QNY9_IXOPE|nr:hypothetical protein HPB47_017254 [Ixodes persulcatus]